MKIKLIKTPKNFLIKRFPVVKVVIKAYYKGY